MKAKLTGLLMVLLLFAGSLASFALGGDPAVLFTDNITVVGTTLAVSEMEQTLLDRLNNASVSIDAAIYSLERFSILDALKAAHNRGVTVRVVTDDDAYNDPDYNFYFVSLETAGIPVIKDNRPSLMHNKFLVIDGQIVWTGSTNLTHTGFTFNHNDSLVFTSTQLAGIYQVEFEEMFTTGLFGTDKTDNTTHTLTYAGSPLEIYFSPSDGAMAELLAEVAGADESIHFSIYFFTADALREAIIARMQSGVVVQGIFDLQSADNPFSEDEALCDAGASIKLEDFSGKLHHKFMVIDAGGSDPVVVSGSMNWTAAGANVNDENVVIIHDAETAQAYLAAFQALYGALGPETLCPQEYFLYLPVVIKSIVAPTPTPSPTATALPTPTATATQQPPSDVKITYILYNPDGDDVEGEYVRLDNLGQTNQVMTNWTLRDGAAHIYTFPAVNLPPGNSLRLWTKAGLNTGSDLYWGSDTAIWNNIGETATLRDNGGQLIDSCTYTGGGVDAFC